MVKNNILSIVLALIIMYLSLSSSDSFEKVSLLNIPFADKIAHFAMYFMLMSVLLFENRKTLSNTRHLFWIALIPFSYGIFLEILQSLFTNSRSGSIYDIIFNLVGILFSLLLWFWIKPYNKETIR